MILRTSSDTEQLRVGMFITATLESLNNLLPWLCLLVFAIFLATIQGVRVARDEIEIKYMSRYVKNIKWDKIKEIIVWRIRNRTVGFDLISDKQYIVLDASKGTLDVVDLLAQVKGFAPSHVRFRERSALFPSGSGLAMLLIMTVVCAVLFYFGASPA